VAGLNWQRGQLVLYSVPMRNPVNIVTGYDRADPYIWFLSMLVGFTQIVSET